MPTIWGLVDRVDAGIAYIQVKVVLSGQTTVRICARVGAHTLIVRGSEREELSNLCEGDCVEIAYWHGRKGFIEAETIAIRPDRAIGQLQRATVPPCEGFARS